MCGIAGVIAHNRGLAERAVAAMNRAQAHRGPDDEGAVLFSVRETTVALGHRRLAIQDLSSAGHQPMEDPETGNTIVFNGEIYNFPELRRELEVVGVEFRSHCDTEAILHAYRLWGTACFDRFQGMYAFGLFVKRDESLLLACDPLGIKPLYYGWGRDGAFVFASELRAVVASGLVENELDRRGLGTLFAFGAVCAPLTMRRDVRMQEAGTWTRFRVDEPPRRGEMPRAVRHWDFPRNLSSSAGDGETETSVRAGVEQVARSHLLSDRPVGVFLSSGLDSTAVAVLCSEERRGDLDLFTVARADDPVLDESSEAIETARRLGARHHDIRLSDAEITAWTERWFDTIDQPTVDGLNTYIISRAVRERHIVVALSGLGGDELFGGYSTFHDVPLITRWLRAGLFIPPRLRTWLARSVTIGATKARRLKALDIAAHTEASIRSIYFRRRRLLSDLEMASFGLTPLSTSLNADFIPPEAEPERSVYSDDPFAAISVLESRFYMRNMLLRDSDVFGMANGIEIRVPFLGRPLIDKVYSLSGALRGMHASGPKPLLVDALGERIRSELLALNKRGFSLPFVRWMNGPLQGFVRESLEIIRASGLVDPGGIDVIWWDFVKDKTGTTWSHLWLLLVFGQWLKRAGHR